MGTDIHIAAEIFKDGRWRLADVDLPENRNYWAFAVLADVRNGYGFAGIDKGDPITPISEPRGLPDNMSTELRALLDRTEFDDGSWFWLGAHSFSWVTLSPENATRFRETGQPPDSWDGWTSKPNYERIEWEEPIRQCASLIPMLIDEIKDLGKPEKVRLVFGFDD